MKNTSSLFFETLSIVIVLRNTRVSKNKTKNEKLEKLKEVKGREWQWQQKKY